MSVSVKAQSGGERLAWKITSVAAIRRKPTTAMPSTEKHKFVFVSVIEVKPLAGCQLDPSEFAGAAVRVYIPGEDGITAMEKLLAVLKEEKFALIGMEFFVEKNSTDWENPDDEDGEALIAEALESEDVIFGEFGAWGYEEFH